MNDIRSYSHYEGSWQEQRNYLEEAVQSLPKALAAEARIELDRMSQHDTVQDSEPMKYKQTNETNEHYELGQFQVSFAADGSINRLMDRSGKEWVNVHQRLGTNRYETFGKPGIEYVKPRPEHGQYTVSLWTLHL